MSRIRSITALPGRRAPLLVALAAAVLLAFALTYEQPGSMMDGGRGSVPDVERNGTAGTVDPASPEDTKGLVDPAVGGPVAAVTPTAGEAGTGDADTSVRSTIGAAATAEGGTSIIDPVGPLGAPSIEARIVRTASLELRVTKKGNFEDAWGAAQAAAGTNGGYVVSSSRSGAGKGPRAATITMRVPSARFDSAVRRLRDISGVSVRRLDVASQDVTQEFVDVRSRLKHDRAVEGRLLALLAQTKGVSEVLAVQSRLDTVQEQIELSKGRLDYLDKMTSMSTIELTISERGARTSGDEDEGSVLGEAWTDARDRFSENVASAIVWLGGALPALVLLALLALVARSIHRRHSGRADRPTPTPGD